MTGKLSPRAARSSRLLQAALALAFAAITPACGGGSKQVKTGPLSASATLGGENSIDRSRCSDSGKQIVAVDTNNDQKPDVWKMYAQGNQGGSAVQLMTCKQVDLNHDKKVDIVYHYDNTAALAMEEFDLDFDGKFDKRAFYQGGKRTREEMDTNFDGRPDFVEYYESGKLVRIERDSNNDGKVDEWQYYEAGKLDRIGYDTTGSGRVDKWERAPDAESAPAAADAAGGTVPASTTTPPAATTPPATN